MRLQALVVYVLATLALSSPTPEGHAPNEDNPTAQVFKNFFPKTPKPRRITRRKASAESTAQLEVVYRGSSRRIAGCYAAVIEAKWALVPRTCIAGRIVVKKTTVGNVPLQAVYTKDEIAALELQRSIKKTAAKIATKVPTNLVLETQNGNRRYRVRDRKWCSKLTTSMQGKGEVCATPLIEEATCPADRRSIAFEIGQRKAGLVGFGIGVDCSADRKEGVSWIAPVVPYEKDIKNLIDGKPNGFVKKSDKR